MESKTTDLSPNNNDMLNDEENLFSCEKCYEMVNYFINECLKLSPQLTKLEKEKYNKLKSLQKCKGKLEMLQFNYEEVKAEKEDFEERYNLLYKTLMKKPDPHNFKIAVRALELANKSQTSTVIIINDLDDDLSNFNIQSNINSYFFLDLDCLTKQITTETTINFELTFKHFAQKANEYRQINSNILTFFKKQITNKSAFSRKSVTNDLNQSTELFERCISLDKENKLLNDENEQLKTKNKSLTDEMDLLKIENTLLKSSYDKASASIQTWTSKYDQAQSQVERLEKLKADLLEDFEKQSEAKSNF
jgi:RNAse (barnase) inhibitor barstar